MKKLTNKGMTLMELLVSVVLISVIMIFMYKLISDVRNEKKENDKITNNILKISEIQVEFYNKIYGEVPRELELVGFWNDIWLNEDVNSVRGHWIRIDLVEKDGSSTGKDYRYQIGIGKKSNGNITLQLRELDATKTKWLAYDLYELEDIADVDIYEKCNFDQPNNDLVCIIELQLLDKNQKNVQTISFPFYFNTKNFVVDKTAKGKITTNISNTKGGNVYTWGASLYKGMVDRVNERTCINKLDSKKITGASDSDVYHCTPFITERWQLNQLTDKATGMEYKKRYSDVLKDGVTLTYDNTYNTTGNSY